MKYKYTWEKKSENRGTNVYPYVVLPFILILFSCNCMVELKMPKMEPSYFKFMVLTCMDARFFK